MVKNKMGFWEKCLLNKMKDEGNVDEKNLDYKDEKLFRKCNILINEFKKKFMVKI